MVYFFLDASAWVKRYYWQAKHEGERDKIALVSTDRRLLRAAEKEGLLTFDPESADIALLEKLLRVESRRARKGALNGRETRYEHLHKFHL